MEKVMEFLKPELLLLVPVLYFIGQGFKQSEGVKDKYIPLLLSAVGIGLAGLYTLATASIACSKDVFMALFVGITQGVLAAGMSVYVDQLFKQAGKEA